MQDRIATLEADKRVFLLEYQKQKMLAEISPNGQRIKDKLAQLDKENQMNEKSARNRIAQDKSNRTIEKITKEDLLEIRKGLQPEQAEAIINLLREREKEKDRISRIQSERNIERITKETLLEIRKDLQRDQSEAIVNLLRGSEQALEQVREKEYEQMREHMREKVREYNRVR